MKQDILAQVQARLQSILCLVAEGPEVERPADLYRAIEKEVSAALREVNGELPAQNQLQLVAYPRTEQYEELRKLSQRTQRTINEHVLEALAAYLAENRPGRWWRDLGVPEAHVRAGRWGRALCGYAFKPTACYDMSPQNLCKSCAEIAERRAR